MNIQRKHDTKSFLTFGNEFKMGVVWNPWHGCHKYSEGCRHCYVYRQDAMHEKDSSIVTKTANFNLPIKRLRDGRYKIPSGELVYACFTSDFFVDDADDWRNEVWAMIRCRKDLTFIILTKRIERFHLCLPEDWGDGYENVEIGCTVENQQMADIRLPIFLQAPIKHKHIICEPLLSAMNLEPYLANEICELWLGGESGNESRVMDYEWVLDISRQCLAHGIPFHFHQTGARLLKDGKVYRINRRFQHSQAARAGLDTMKNRYKKT